MYAVLIARSFEVLGILGNRCIRSSIERHIQNHVIVRIS